MQHFMPGVSIRIAALVVAAMGIDPSLGSTKDGNSAESHAALVAMQAELAANPILTQDLLGKDFAAVSLTKADSAAARSLLWNAHAAHIAKERASEIHDRVLKDGDLEMPYSTRVFGEKPAAGWSLWISLHGGGGAPKAVNDQQYENQKQLYQLKEGIYLTPRAPTDSWNLWHQPHIDRLLSRLIEDWIVSEEVDPDRVYLMGYSAGGDGVYQLAPRMADYWAAAAMMAGHPNDASPLGLRNVPFVIQVGAEDSAYNRNKVAIEWGEKLAALRKSDPSGYRHFVKLHDGKGHWMDLEDKLALPWMARFRRNPIPNRVVWKQATTTHDQLYWLAVPPGQAKSGSLVAASIHKQAIQIDAAEQVTDLWIRLDDRMLDLDQPVRVVYRGRTLFHAVVQRTIGGMAKSLLGRCDPKLMFDAEVRVTLPDDDAS